MALSPADQARLAALKAKRDALISGDARRSVQSGGRRVENFQGDADRLQAEIEALESASTSSTGAVRKRGALTFSVRR